MGQNASTTQGLATTTTTESSPTTIKPPDEPPEKTHKNDHHLISEGRVFTRYCLKKGVPSRSEVLVSYHKVTKSICWSSPDSVKYDPLHSMKIKDISKVWHGKHTAALQTPLAVDAPDRFCFSIVSHKLHRSLDLEASEETTAAEFARAVDNVMEQAKATRARWSLPSPPYQMPVTQASLSRALNASLIQFNPKLKGQIRPGMRKSKSKKGSRVSSDSRHIVRAKQHSQLGTKPRVGSKRKKQCSPVITPQSHVVLANCPTEFIDTSQ